VGNDGGVPTGPHDTNALLAELDELRRENARLRDLLGLGSRADDGHAVAWSPTLFAQPSTADRLVDASSALRAKLALL
jgi:hypothetical protein